MGLTILMPNRDVITYRGVRWWAERGMIHSEYVDSAEGKKKYRIHMVRTIKIRLRARQDGINAARKKSGGGLWPDELAAEQRYVQQMVELCIRAQEQGMPDNPDHAKQKTNDMRARRHSYMVVMPGLLTEM